MPSENPRIPLPKSWPRRVQVAILHVVSLAQFATAHTRSWAANSINARIRLQAERDRALEEVSRPREEIRIKDARMATISPHRRPHYPPVERLAILELKAARGWSLEQTARVFHVTAPTIASWLVFGSMWFRSSFMFVSSHLMKSPARRVRRQGDDNYANGRAGSKRDESGDRMPQLAAYHSSVSQAIIASSIVGMPGPGAMFRKSRRRSKLIASSRMQNRCFPTKSIQNR